MTKHKIDPASVAFDIDGVVANTMKLFLDIARDEYHIEGLKYENITCYMLNECLGLETKLIDEIIVKILDGNHGAALEPLPQAPEVLRRIGRERMGRGCVPAVLFVTARPYAGKIRNWMAQHLSLDPEAIEVVTTGSFEAKAEVLLNRGISCFVEDRLETCFQLKEAGITPVLFKQPWNREHHPFTEVQDWRELESLMAL